MIESIEQADRLIRHYQSQINCREHMGPGPGFWPPTDDPREVVRRANYLFANGGEHMNAGESRAEALRAYVAALAAELAVTPDKDGKQ